MEGWSLFFMLVVLKIPLIAALFIIWYAIKSEPAADEEADGGLRGPRHHRPRPPRPPRRPAGGVGCRPSPSPSPSPCPQLVRPRLARPARLPARR
jgi:hypothetical protein